MTIGAALTSRTRLLAAGTVAAIAATVLLFGGVFGQDTAARPGPFAAEAEVKRGYAELELARVRVDPSRYPVAEARFREAMRIGGADALALRGLAGLAAARHRFDQSLELAQRARKLDPTNAAVYGLIGDASLELGRFPQAIEAFDRMMSLKPTPSGYARVSYARELLGERDGAIEAMQMSADAAGHSEPAAWALTHLGNLQVGTGELALGVQQYRAALARVPAYAPALVGLADVAQRRGERARAERLLRRALAQVDDPGASATLGDVLAEQGRTDEANDWYRRSLALETTFARYGGRNQVETALFDLDHDRNLPDALERARVGLRFRPGVEGLHTYAWALYKNGRCAEAVPYSDRALALAPTDTGALYHRSLIERCLGNRKAGCAIRVASALARPDVHRTVRVPAPLSRLRAPSDPITSRGGDRVLTRNAVDVLPEGGLERKLALGRPLRVKLGIDVTAPHIHIGNGIPLQRMRAFQDEGHTGVLIVGDYTARIGDPSGALRRAADDPARGDRPHGGALLRVRVHDPRPRADRGAVQRRVARRARLRRGAAAHADDDRRAAARARRLLEAVRRAAAPISVSELLYPLMQAYDSVAVEADVELGGTDQLYNLLAGREVMEAYGLEPQVVLTTPLIDSWDGSKMSGSKGNYIALVEDPSEQFGKAMRLPDELLDDYYRLVMESDDRPPRPARGEARARTLHRHARARRRRPRAAPRSTSPASSGRGRRRTRSSRSSCRGPTRSTCRACSSTASGSALRARPAG